MARKNNFLKFNEIYGFLSKLNKREKTILYAAAFVVLLTLLDRMLIYPVYSKIKMLSLSIKEKESGIVKDMRVISQKDRILSEAAKYVPFVSSADSEEENLTALLKEVESMADKNSLYIIDMKPAGVKEEKDKTKKYTVNFSCEGQMDQIMAFMYSVENSNSLLTVERYQISPKSKESTVAQCSMTISKVVM